VTAASIDQALSARLQVLSQLADDNPDLLFFNQEHGFVARKIAKTGKVAIVSGGGSGHEPLHTGYVGHGMLDAACVGHYFSSPTPGQIAAAAVHVECGQGVLFVVKNYQGDVLNFALAAQMCRFPVETVLVSDDVATSDPESGGGRGLAGTLLVEKIIGAAAEAGLDIHSLKRLGDMANARTTTYGVALSSCRIPGARGPIYELDHGAMEIGVGIHGERGRARVKAGTTRQIAALLAERVLSRFVSPPSNPVMIVNGLGGTPHATLQELSSACLECFIHHGINPVRTLVGTYVTALDTVGYSLTLSHTDPGTLEFWDAPVRTAALQW
jgi:phosphoenolpyruvate---glycerone phosphotransferase subunit DhaK